MKKWLIRSGPVGMALIWFVGWALGAGGFMEAFIDPRGEIADIWPMVLGIPGAVCGVMFWLVLRVAEGGRAADALPTGRLLAWGAVSGAVVGSCGFAVSVAGDASVEAWVRALVFIGVPTALSAISAVATSWLLRLIERRQTPAAAGHTS